LEVNLHVNLCKVTLNENYVYFVASMAEYHLEDLLQLV